MKSLLNGIWAIPLFSGIAYICVYVYNMTYLKYFDIPISIANILLEDFFSLGLFVICISVLLFMTLLREDITEKNSLESLTPIKGAKIIWILIVPLGALYVFSYIFADKNLYLMFAFFFLIEFLCFVYRALVRENTDAIAWSNVIIAFLLSVGMSYYFALSVASKQSEFVGFEINNKPHKYNLLIKRNANSEGLFKVYDKNTNEWEAGFYILNVNDKHYNIQTIKIKEKSDE